MDYIEPVLFGAAAGKVIESYVNYFCSTTDRVVAHFHEWMTASGGLYPTETFALRCHGIYHPCDGHGALYRRQRTAARNGDMTRLNADELARRFNVLPNIRWKRRRPPIPTVSRRSAT